jgi:hypothetical protein
LVETTAAHLATKLEGYDILENNARGAGGRLVDAVWGARGEIARDVESLEALRKLRQSCSSMFTPELE